MQEKESAFARFASKISLKQFALLCAAALLVLALLVWGFVGLLGAIFGDHDEVTLFSQGLLAVRDDDDKWGYLNEKGDLAIECQFDTATAFNQKGRAVVSLGGEYFFINKKGERTDATLTFASVGDFAANGLARATKKLADGSYKYGFVNEKGKLVIDCRYDKADPFTESGYAAVRLGSAWGAIDAKGETVLEMRYADVTVSATEARFWVVNENGLMAMLDAKGRERIPFGMYANHEDFSQGLAAVCDQTGKWGFVNPKGKLKIECAFSIGVTSSTGSTAPRFKNGYCGVVSTETGLWSFINTRGKLIGEYRYSSILPFTESGLAAVAIWTGEKEEAWGFINKKSEAVIDFVYTDALNFNKDGWTTVEQNDKYGIINEKGKVLVAPTYESIAPASLDEKHITAFPAEGDGCLLIHRKGKVLRTFPAFQTVWTFADGYSLVRNEEGKYGVLNAKGEVMVACTYDSMVYDSEGLNRVLLEASRWS